MVMPDTLSVRPATNGLFLSRVLLSDFRNYATAEIRPQSQIVVLTGANGAGKTNILEAVSLLGRGRGLRGAAFADIGRIGASRPWSVNGDLSAPHGTTSIGTGYGDPSRGETARARKVRIDGSAERGTRVLDELIRIVWLSPALDGLFTGPAFERRGFFDRIVSSLDTAHGGRLAKYDKLRRQRTRLLGEGRTEPAWLDSLERQMAQAGVSIAAARRDTLACMRSILGRTAANEERLRLPGARLFLEGELECWLDDAPAIEVEERYCGVLAGSRNHDAHSGRTAHGPHRTDFLVHHATRNMAARLCSTGEQKALLLRLVLAHAKAVELSFGCAPLVLLDEVCAHIDDDRREVFFAFLATMGSQVWLTGTNRTLFAAFGADASYFRVVDGDIRAAQGND